MNALTRIRWFPCRTAQPSPYRRATPMLLEAVGGAIWRTLEAVGRRRAIHALQAAADRYASSNPALARLLRVADDTVPTHVREAAEVRALAAGYHRADPRFAAELCCAADRHERLAEERTRAH
jgi:hypothetical protein